MNHTDKQNFHKHIQCTSTTGGTTAAAAAAAAIEAYK